MKRLAAILLALAAAALVAAAALRRHVPTYPDWRAWAEADQEGDALEPDPYLDGLR